MANRLGQQARPVNRPKVEDYYESVLSRTRYLANSKRVAN